MTRFQNWLTRLLFRLVPQLKSLINSSGGTIDRLAEEVSLLRADRDYRRDQNMALRAEYAEAAAMAGSGPWLSTPAGSPALRESAKDVGGTAQVALKERLWDLELALEDQGWARSLAQSQMEFSRWGIQQIILLSRLYRIKNPLIQRGVLVSSYYVFGRGVEVSSEYQTVNDVLQEFFEDPRNLPEIGQKALTEKEATLYTDGNIFWALFSSVDDGRVVVRTIDATEISEIICDPNDSAVPWYYHRCWTQESFDVRTGNRGFTNVEAWYVADGFDPPAGLKEINSKPVMMDSSGDYVRIIHQKDGGLMKWHFGCPRVYAAIDWARAYRERLENYASLTKALARFAWDIKTKGGSPAIAALKGSFATTLVNDGSMIEQNPPPVAGAAFVSGPNETINPVRTAGMIPSPEEGRRLAHMVYMVFGLPETFFSDVSVGTLATATSLDRPTELKFLQDQEIWREVLQRIGRFVIEKSAKAPKGRLKEAAAKSIGTMAKIEVKFPAILEGDHAARVAAIVQGMTLGQPGITGIDEKTGIGLLLMELGVEDVAAVLEAMYPDSDYDANRENQKQAAADDEQARMDQQLKIQKATNALKPAVKEALLRLGQSVNAL